MGFHHSTCRLPMNPPPFDTDLHSCLLQSLVSFDPELLFVSLGNRSYLRKGERGQGQVLAGWVQETICRGDPLDQQHVFNRSQGFQPSHHPIHDLMPFRQILHLAWVNMANTVRYILDTQHILCSSLAGHQLPLRQPGAQCQVRYSLFQPSLQPQRPIIILFLVGSSLLERC